MANCVFFHKPDSIYDDLPEERYHFPKNYLKRVSETIGDYIVYYGPMVSMRGTFYYAIAKVERVEIDPQKSNHYYAYVSNYVEFDQPVPFRQNGGFEHRLLRADGSVNGGWAVNAVRPIDREEFLRLVDLGLSRPPQWPDRRDEPSIAPPMLFAGEMEQAAYEHDPAGPVAREVVDQRLTRPFRDIKFKQHIREAYDRTCAFTGLRLINGHGRPEVEAAHIKPVEKGGPDSIRNGLALSGTVHWMFDRGLLSLDNNFNILRSRHLNHDVSHLLVQDLKARVPAMPHLRPHPTYLDWHRRECFKA
jgi:putative restriction endonuclease